MDSSFSYSKPIVICFLSGLANEAMDAKKSWTTVEEDVEEENEDSDGARIYADI